MLEKNLKNENGKLNEHKVSELSQHTALMLKKLGEIERAKSVTNATYKVQR